MDDWADAEADKIVRLVESAARAGIGRLVREAVADRLRIAHLRGQEAALDKAIPIVAAAGMVS